MVFSSRAKKILLANRGRSGPDDSMNRRFILLFEVISCIIEVMAGKKKEL
jgi:hypothetical protein